MATPVQEPRRSTRGAGKQLASKLEQLVFEGHLPPGSPLVERALAERFMVSRSPVREALRILAERGVVEQRTDGGYAVLERLQEPPATPFLPESPSQDESIYLQIAEDRLANNLPEKVTETELMRRYQLTKVQLASVLRRIVSEGWIERLPGNGWQFQPILTSGDAYSQAYNFRILIETGALEQPGFCVDAVALRKCLAEQQALIDGAVEWASPAQLFDANTRLHETIAAFSGNVFILESLRRINRLRRLMEYRKAVDRVAAARRCKEHKTLIELLLSGNQEAAASFLRLHLRDAAREKSAQAQDAVAP